MEKQIHTDYDLVKVAVFTETYKAVLKLKENPEDLEAKAVYNALINVMENAALLDEFKKVKRHKTMQEVKKILGKSEVIEEEKCPQCGGITVTNYGPGISCTFCVDCDYNDYDYDL